MPLSEDIHHPAAVLGRAMTRMDAGTAGWRLCIDAWVRNEQSAPLADRTMTQIAQIGQISQRALPARGRWRRTKVFEMGTAAQEANASRAAGPL
jgi:hypothetical protein